MDYRDKFYEQYVSTHTSHRYGTEGRSENENNFPVWRNYFGRFLPSSKEARILDLGCGDGGFLSWLSKEGFTDLTGVDVSEEQVDKAKSFGLKDVHRGDVLDFLRQGKGAYDLIFARDLVEHLTKEEILSLFELIAGSLKLGGGFVIQTVNGEGPLAGRLGYGDFTHETILTRTSLSQALRVAGFGDIDVFTQAPAVHGLKSFVRFCLWSLFQIGIRLYVLVETGSAEGIFSQNIIVLARKK